MLKGTRIQPYSMYKLFESSSCSPEYLGINVAVASIHSGKWGTNTLRPRRRRGRQKEVSEKILVLSKRDRTPLAAVFVVH